MAPNNGAVAGETPSAVAVADAASSAGSAAGPRGVLLWPRALAANAVQPNLHQRRWCRAAPLPAAPLVVAAATVLSLAELPPAAAGAAALLLIASVAALTFPA